jgi:hypothetical protein
MMDDSPSALGPLFGPDFIIVKVNEYSLEVYPDANNALLKANGLPQQFYYVPQRVYLAKKQDSPQDFDFGMTVFKGLMTSESDVVVTGADVEIGGGFCTFSTTFAIPDSVIAGAIAALQTKQYQLPQDPSRVQQYLPGFASSDPAPLLGVVPILANAVSIDVPQLSMSGTPQAPLQISAQSAQKGSIEAQGISSFLVTCNQLAAGAIAGSLKGGVSPFTVYYDLMEQFYLPACDITVTIDMDKVYDSFSAAVSMTGLFGSDSFQGAWSSCVTNGGIVTDIKISDAALADGSPLKQFIDQNCQDMQKNAIDIVKSQIFDWQPKDSDPATTSGGGSLFNRIFANASVSMKANYQRRAIHTTQEFKLDTTITKEDVKSGDLNDLEPAIKANLSKYLAIVDVGQFFQKIQVAATNTVNWSEQFPDGTMLKDPIAQVMIEVGYPDINQPLGTNNQPNLITHAQGSHYMPGQPAGQLGIAMWNKDTPRDVINISFLRLDNPIQGWPTDQVHVRRTIVLDKLDPRIDLNPPPPGTQDGVIVLEENSTDHAPVLTGFEMGYVYVQFRCRPIPAAVTVTLTIKLGARTDTLELSAQNQQTYGGLWQIWSDKYVQQDSFTYSVQVMVQGPGWTDTPITYSSAQPITVPLPSGAAKYLPLVMLQLPPVPDAQTASKINDYIARYAQQQLASAK